MPPPEYQLQSRCDDTAMNPPHAGFSLTSRAILPRGPPSTVVYSGFSGMAVRSDAHLR